ncbi:MAG: VOC family protein [Cyclobacteriaceae bacterium]
MKALLAEKEATAFSINYIANLSACVCVYVHAMIAEKLSPRTRLGYVQLRTPDLSGQLDFYTRLIGLKVHWQEAGRAGLGTGHHDLLRLVEVPDAKHYPKTTGLYHQAFLLPDRRELARAIARIASFRYPQSPTDHMVSGTTYLNDADGNTVELYVATPGRGTWSSDGQVWIIKTNDGTPHNGREPLNVEAYLDLLSSEEDLHAPLSPDTITGHVHLYMNDLGRGMQFYSDTLGLYEHTIARKYQMAETILPDYDVHFVAFNTWKGATARPAPADAVGLDHYSIELYNQVDKARLADRFGRDGIRVEENTEGMWVNDPAGNSLLIRELIS